MIGEKTDLHCVRKDVPITSALPPCVEDRIYPRQLCASSGSQMICLPCQRDVRVVAPRAQGAVEDVA